MVAIGRALMAKPDLLAIDELSLGLAPLVVAELAEHLRFLNRERGTAILLVEQEVSLAFELCPRTCVLEAGRVVAAGTERGARGERSGPPRVLRRPHGAPTSWSPDSADTEVHS